MAFFTAADFTSFAAVQIGGTVHTMVQGPSGSGMRYLEIDGAVGYIIHTKGDDLLLSKQEAEVAEELLLAECTAQIG